MKSNYKKPQKNSGRIWILTLSILKLERQFLDNLKIYLLIYEPVHLVDICAV